MVIATLDPNPLVAGNGVEILEKAGIEVITGVCEEESRQMNEVFNKYIVTKKPFVSLKSAITLDGKIATAFLTASGLRLRQLVWMYISFVMKRRVS